MPHVNPQQWATPPKGQHDYLGDREAVPECQHRLVPPGWPEVYPHVLEEPAHPAVHLLAQVTDRFRVSRPCFGPCDVHRLVACYLLGSRPVEIFDDRALGEAAGRDQYLPPEG